MIREKRAPAKVIREAQAADARGKNRPTIPGLGESVYPSIVAKL